jgi:hypothetical protein
LVVIDMLGGHCLLNIMWVTGAGGAGRSDILRPGPSINFTCIVRLVIS